MIDCNKCIHKTVCGKVRYKNELDLSRCGDYDTGRPHGEWKFAEEYGTHYCSNCKHFAFNDWLFDYCPDCGAEMWR